MASSLWGTSRRLDESLFEAGHEFDFFQAVRLLTLMNCEKQTGTYRLHEGEFVRFAVESALAFPASSILQVEKSSKASEPTMTVRFLGLIGPLGVLPSSYTEIAIDQKAFGDHSFAAFFDIFHHRLLQLFYRAWEKHHFFVGYELARARSGIRDAMTSYLLNLIGLGPSGLQKRLPFKDDALLRYAGLILQRPHSSECLRALLQDFFRIPVRIEQFLGKWHTLESRDLCALGSGEKNCELGCGALAGDAVWTRQSLVRAVLGPLPAAEFFRFLPCGGAFKKLVHLLRWFLGPALDFELQPVLASGEDPTWCRLGEFQLGGLRLGWSSWLTDQPFERPATDAVFGELEGVAAEETAWR